MDPETVILKELDIFGYFSLIWVPHEREGFVAASILDEKSDGTIKVQIVETGQNMEYSKDECQRMNPPKFEKV